MAVIGVQSNDLAKRGSAAASRARRCLFGRPTEIESVDTMSEWREHEQRINEEKQRKWNFNFQQMKPLPGRWEWERVRGPANQQTPTVDRDPDDTTLPTATATVTAGPPTDEASPSTVSSEGDVPQQSASCTTTTVEPSYPAADADTPTCSAEPRPKRSRQTTLKGIVRQSDMYIIPTVHVTLRLTIWAQLWCFWRLILLSIQL